MVICHTHTEAAAALHQRACQNEGLFARLLAARSMHCLIYLRINRSMPEVARALFLNEPGSSLKPLKRQCRIGAAKAEAVGNSKVDIGIVNPFTDDIGVCDFRINLV